MDESTRGVVSKSWKVIARWRLAILLTLMLPLVLGARRGEPSGCGRASDPRQLIFVSNAGNRTITPSPNRTQDIPLDLAARTIQYRGDESSALYAWSEQGSGETLIGRRYFAVSQFLGQRSNHSAERFTFEASGVDLVGGIPIVRQYDRGNCSVFQSWGSFQDTLKNALDQFAQGRGARHYTTSTLTPLLALDATVPTGRIYPGDTNDTFRFTRGYSINNGPLGYFMIVRIEGGFRTSAGAVRFTPTSITVRNHVGDSDPETGGLELALNDEFVNQLNRALDDMLFRRLPARLLQINCNPSLPSDPQCTTRLSESGRVDLSPAQTRCQRRSDAPGTGGFCEFRPDVLRTQEYPEGFEFVLSEVLDDPGQRLLVVYGNDSDGFCADGPRAPVPLDGTIRGIVRRFDSP